MKKLVIANGHPTARLGIRVLAESCSVWGLVVEAADGNEMLDAAALHAPDLVVADLSIQASGALKGVALIRTLRRRHPVTRVVVLVESGNGDVVDQLVGIGVSGVVSKRDSVEALSKAITTLDSPGTYISGDFHVRRSSFFPRGNEARLTPAEIEVLSQLSNQLSVSAIAAGRSRSVATISKQKQSAMRKLGITSSHQLHVYLSQVRNDTDDA